MSGSIPELELCAGSKKARLIVYPDRLQLVNEKDNTPQEIRKDEAPEKVEIIDNLFFRRGVVLCTPKRNVFQLKEEDFPILKDWVGPPTQRHLEVLLAKTWKWALPIGAIWILSALPMEGDPELGIEAFPSDIFGLAMGIAIIVLGYLAKRIPHRIYLLLDALWFVALGGNSLFQIVTAQASAWWLITLALSLPAIAFCVDQYRRFSPEQLTSLSKPQENMF